MSHNKLKNCKVDNNDGTSFYWFDLTTFPEKPPLIISKNLPEIEPSMIANSFY